MNTHTGTLVPRAAGRPTHRFRRRHHRPPGRGRRPDRRARPRVGRRRRHPQRRLPAVGRGAGRRPGEPAPAPGRAVGRLPAGTRGRPGRAGRRRGDGGSDPGALARDAVRRRGSGAHGPGDDGDPGRRPVGVRGADAGRAAGGGVLLPGRAPPPGAHGSAGARAVAAGGHAPGPIDRRLGVRAALGGAGAAGLDAVRRRSGARSAGTAHLRRRVAAHQLRDGQPGVGADRAAAGARPRPPRPGLVPGGGALERGRRAAGSTRTTGSGIPPAGWSRRAASSPAPR